MKWYKKQLDQLKKTKQIPAETSRLEPAKPEPVGNSFREQKNRFKKIAKPGEKRSRPKTDSK